MKARLRDLSFGVDGKQILSLIIEGDFRDKWDARALGIDLISPEELSLLLDESNR